MAKTTETPRNREGDAPGRGMRFRSLVVLLGEDRADEASHRVAVGEDAVRVGSPASGASSQGRSA